MLESAPDGAVPSTFPTHTWMLCGLPTSCPAGALFSPSWWHRRTLPIAGCGYWDWGLGSRLEVGEHPHHPRPDPDGPAAAHNPTCERVGAGQVVTREVNEGMVLRVDKLRLGSHVAGVLHGAGRVDDVHLQQRDTAVQVRPRAEMRLRSDQD